MATKVQEQSKSEFILSKEEARAIFDEAIPRLLGISGEEFLRRYDAGEYADLPDTPEFRDELTAIFLIPFGRPDS
jgi:hypothetical protein